MPQLTTLRVIALNFTSSHLWARISTQGPHGIETARGGLENSTHTPLTITARSMNALSEVLQLNVRHVGRIID